MDDITGALGVSLDTEDVSEVAEACLAEINRLQALEEPRHTEEAYGGTWGQHSTHTPDDWRLDVENNDTRSGYWEWVIAQLEAAEPDPNAALLTGEVDYQDLAEGGDGKVYAGTPEEAAEIRQGSIDHMPDRNSDKERID